MRFVVACLVLLISTLAANAQEMQRAAPPPWVEELALPAIDPRLRAEAQGGVHFILADRQLQWQDQVMSSYTRTVSEVTDRAGLEAAATINIDFDPLFEAITLTRLALIRDGQSIDLRDTVRVEVLRREQRLDQGIIDGTLTLWIQIPDLRVGDLVDTASLRVMQPVLPGANRSLESFLDWSVPVQITRVLAFWPTDWPLHMAPLPEGIRHSQTPMPDGQTQRLEWQRLSRLPEQWEPNTPPGHGPDLLLRVSADADWGALSAMLSPHYAADYPLTPEWDARVDAIAAASPDPATRAISALRLVQDDLRYVSLSVGAGGYLARAPQEVITSGFGDCKDKALLLVVILRRLGVEAAVALTDLDGGKALDLALPSVGAFDHAIVRIMIDGTARWVDATASHQGGDFASGTTPDYGWALPLTGADQTSLEPIALPDLVAPTSDVTESFVFNQLGVMLEVRTVYAERMADETRQRWATSPASQISRDFLGYYQARYPGMTQMRDIEMTDDRATNLVITVERYLLPNAALAGSDLQLDFPFAAENYTSNLPERLTAPRKALLDVGRRASARHRVIVDGAPLQFRPPPDMKISNPGFRFVFSGRTTDSGGMQLTWTFDRDGTWVAAQDAAGVIDDGREVTEATWLTWNVTPDHLR